MNKEQKAKIQSLVQSRIDGFHTTKARPYTSTTPNGVAVSRIGLSVYLEDGKGDKQVELISKTLEELSAEGKAGNPDPIIVKVDGTEFVVVGAQKSNYKTEDGKENYSKRPKVILADLLIGSNAEVSQDERAKSIRLLQEMRESNKSLKSQFSGVRSQTELKKAVEAVTEEEFDEFLS